MPGIIRSVLCTQTLPNPSSMKAFLSRTLLRSLCRLNFFYFSSSTAARTLCFIRYVGQVRIRVTPGMGRGGKGETDYICLWSDWLVFVARWAISSSLSLPFDSFTSHLRKSIQKHKRKKSCSCLFWSRQIVFRPMVVGQTHGGGSLHIRKVFFDLIN